MCRSHLARDGEPHALPPPPKLYSSGTGGTRPARGAGIARGVARARASWPQPKSAMQTTQKKISDHLHTHALWWHVIIMLYTAHMRRHGHGQVLGYIHSCTCVCTDHAPSAMRGAAREHMCFWVGSAGSFLHLRGSFLEGSTAPRGSKKTRRGLSWIGGDLRGSDLDPTRGLMALI